MRLTVLSDVIVAGVVGSLFAGLLYAVAGASGATDIVGTCLLKEVPEMVGGRELRCANPDENVWICEENR